MQNVNVPVVVGVVVVELVVAFVGVVVVVDYCKYTEGFAWFVALVVDREGRHMPMIGWEIVVVIVAVEVVVKGVDQGVVVETDEFVVVAEQRVIVVAKNY